MKTLIMAITVAFAMSGCNAQEKDTIKDLSAHEVVAHSVPRGTWKVTKELDENGNLIRYDSIYTYSYGNVNGREIPAPDLDSAMANFERYMQQMSPPSFNGMMANPSAKDSLRNNFYERGVFSNHWEDFFSDMKEQIKMMDSLHRAFMQQTQPGLFPPEERKK